MLFRQARLVRAIRNLSHSSASRALLDSELLRRAAQAGGVTLCVFGLLAGLLNVDPTLAAGLDTWTSRNSGTICHLAGVAYGNGQFVAIGSAAVSGSGTILTSPDGINWTSRNSGTPNDLSAVAYGNGIFVAVGAGADSTGGTILTSPDGVVWTSRTSANTHAIYLQAAAFGNGLFVIAGIGGAILTSPDGVSWTDRSQETDNAPFNSVLYANGQFVAVGGDESTDSLIFTSPDGITWTRRNSGVLNDLFSVAYGNGVYVVTGNYDGPTGHPVILTSPDAITWTSRDLFLSATDLFCVAFGNGVFVAVGGQDLPGNSSLLITSTDGVTWTRQNSSTQEGLFGVANGGNTFVAVGASGTIIQAGGTAATQTQAAALTSPLTTAPLPGATATFNWDAGVGVDFYWLDLGTTVGGTNLFSSGAWVTSHSQTVSGLPQTGQPIYVTLYSDIGGKVYYRPYVYTGATATTSGLPLDQALNTTGLTWTTGGDANWSGQTVVTHDGVSAAQSGSVTNGQESWLKTSVTGPATLSFWWKVDSLENVNYLSFEVDGTVQLFISGQKDWAQQTVPIAAGSHTVQWVYNSDEGEAGAETGWVDQVMLDTGAGTGSGSTTSLSYRPSAGHFTLIWPVTGDQYVPESTDSLVSPNWIPVTDTPSTVNGNFELTVAVGPSARFFRLRRP